MRISAVVHRGLAGQAAISYIVGVKTQSPDTSPEAERVLIELLRTTMPWRKVQMIEDTNRTLRAAALAGLRERQPHDSPAVLRRRLADLWLGRDLAARAYGPFREPSPEEQ